MLATVWRWIGNRWVIVKDGWAAVRPSWIAALVTIGAAVALQNAQALDALQEIAEGSSGPRFTLFGSVLLLAFAAWYFPRALLYVNYKRYTPTPTSRHDKLRTWGPRLLAMLPFLSVCGAFAKLGKWWHVLLYLAVAALLLWWLVRRRRKQPPQPLQPSLPKVTYRIAVGIQLLSLVCLIFFLNSKVLLPQALGPLGILLLAAAMWISFGSMVLIYPTYRFSAPSGVFLLLLLAGIFSCWNDNHQVRLDASAADPTDLTDEKAAKAHALATTKWRQSFDAYLDDWRKHRDLTGEGAQEKQEAYPLFVVAAEGGGIRAAYWTAAVLAELEDQVPGFSCHVFAISGVSGGSLGGAAFASLVAKLVDANRLDCRAKTQRERSKEDKLAPKAYEALSEDFLSPTLAGMFFPDVVQRFWPIPNEGPLRALAMPDRATYLERAWEEAGYGDEKVPLGFAEPFRNLWQDDRAYRVPALFLNGTWVESGGRVVTTNIDFQVTEKQPASEKAAQGQNGSDDGESEAQSEAPTDRPATDEDSGEECNCKKPQSARAEEPDRPRFVRLDDMLGCLGQPIPLSTAVHMSARFTYVSPAGTVKVLNPDKCIAAGGKFGARLHVVDGGYFENSGGHTAAEIVDGLERAGWRGPIYSLIISNNPENPNASPVGASRNDSEVEEEEKGQEEGKEDSDEDEDEESEKGRPFGETLSPVYALLNTRSARGFYAEAYLGGQTDESARFQLRAEAETDEPETEGDGPETEPEEATFPLGWTLSADTEKRIQDQASSDCSLVQVCGLIYNKSRCAAARQQHAAVCGEDLLASEEACVALLQLIGECDTSCALLEQKLKFEQRCTSGDETAAPSNSAP